MPRCLFALLAFLAAAPQAKASDKAIEAAFFILEGTSIVAKSDEEVLVETQPRPEPSGVQVYLSVRVTRVGRCVFERRASRAIMGDSGQKRIGAAEFNRIDFSRFKTLRDDGGITIAEGSEGFACMQARVGLGVAETLLEKPEPLECGDEHHLISIETGRAFDRKLADQAIERLRKETCFR